ncbi:serine/arginine repetitive matrix protein 3-like [Heliangelus exortis]|uniref:serine/arginine repetitive matrix protein 3-like n=1 Tax=Heliangelus exortis TaxID=472823 RepID=UPI003A921823
MRECCLTRLHRNTKLHSSTRKKDKVCKQASLQTRSALGAAGAGAGRAMRRRRAARYRTKRRRLGCSPPPSRAGAAGATKPGEQCEGGKEAAGVDGDGHHLDCSGRRARPPEAAGEWKVSPKARPSESLFIKQNKTKQSSPTSQTPHFPCSSDCGLQRRRHRRSPVTAARPLPRGRARTDTCAPGARAAEPPPPRHRVATEPGSGPRPEPRPLPLPRAGEAERGEGKDPQGTPRSARL